MLNNNVETQKKDIIEKYLVMANYYRRLSFFKKIKLKYFGDNLFYNKKNLLMDSIKKFYSQKYDNLINVVSNYESICDCCNTRIDHDKYNQFKNIVIPKIQNYKKEQLSLLWMDFPEVFGASSNFFVDIDYTIKKLNEKLNKNKCIGIEIYNEKYSPAVFVKNKKDGFVNMYDLFMDLAGSKTIYDREVNTQNYDTKEINILASRMYDITNATEGYISNYIQCMNDDNDFLARYDITKYDKAVYNIKACDFLIWKEFENQTLHKDYLLPTKDIKEEMKSILLEIENLAKKTIVERTPDSYATYKTFLKDKYEHFIKNFYSHDVSRINFGEYSLRLISDVLCNGRTFYNSHPVNIEGNKILFNVFSRYKYVVLFDVETTGLDPNNDDIIQFACERYSLTDKDVEMIDHNNIYITLQNGKNIPTIIEKLTNISNETLSNKGVPRSEAREIIRKIFQPTEKTLFVAYNAHFDISFIEKLLDSDNIILHNIDFYDPYVTFTNIPFWYDSSNKIKHFENKKLETIIKMLNINAKNSHNACDDCHALFEIMKRLEECGMGNYIIKYINCLYLPEIESFTLPQIKYIYST